jgi:hypothetical protein
MGILAGCKGIATTPKSKTEFFKNKAKNTVLPTGIKKIVISQPLYNYV